MGHLGGVRRDAGRRGAARGGLGRYGKVRGVFGGRAEVGRVFREVTEKRRGTGAGGAEREEEGVRECGEV